MQRLRAFTVIVATLVAAGEVGRWWGHARLVPLVLDELLVAAAMLGAAIVAPRAGVAPLAAAWGMFCGLAASLLIPTVDHLLHGPPKASAGMYSMILGAMLVIGLGAVGYALSLDRKGRNLPRAQWNTSSQA